MRVRHNGNEKLISIYILRIFPVMKKRNNFLSLKKYDFPLFSLRLLCKWHPVIDLLFVFFFDVNEVMKVSKGQTKT